MTERPCISVVVATRHRPRAIEACLASLATLSPAADEILIVDQSGDDRTGRAVAAVLVPGLRYLRQEAVGVSRGRNLGLDQAVGDVVVFTDDDCEVDRGLIRAVTEALARHPDAAMLFGRVEAAAHDESLGLIPCFAFDPVFVARSMLDSTRLGGMGACIVVRREAAVRLGGFDVCLGAGAPFLAAEETDLAVRALAAGLTVVEEPTVRVTHHGFRAWREIDALSEGYLFGTGAMYGKQARLWPGVTALRCLHMAARWAVGRPRIRYLRQPRRWLRLRAFARGWWRGLRAPLDRSTACFVPVE